MKDFGHTLFSRSILFSDCHSHSRWAFLLRQTAPAVNILGLTLIAMRTSMLSSMVSFLSLLSEWHFVL